MPTKGIPGDIILPAIREACQDVADDIAGHRDPMSLDYLISFRPTIRAFVTISQDTLADHRPAEIIRSVRTRLEQIHLSCSNAVTKEFDNPHEDTVIEFSLGDESPPSTI